MLVIRDLKESQAVQSQSLERVLHFDPKLRKAKRSEDKVWTRSFARNLKDSQAVQSKGLESQADRRQSLEKVGRLLPEREPSGLKSKLEAGLFCNQSVQIQSLEQVFPLDPKESQAVPRQGVKAWSGSLVLPLKKAKWF